MVINNKDIKRKVLTIALKYFSTFGYEKRSF